MVAGITVPAFVVLLVAMADGRRIEASSIAPLSASQVLEAKVPSPALGFDVPYLVYLPPGYDSEPARRFPVLYMLHSLGGDRYQWRQQGLFSTADALIRSGAIQPMIIVTPEGRDSYWIDHANGGPRWGTFVARELVSEIDRKYRSVPGREYRAIGGASMGAHGALQLAMNSKQFGVVGAHSIALRRFEERFPFFGDRTYFEAHDPVTLCIRNRAQAADLVIWMDIGEDDNWLPGAKAFHEQLNSERVLHSWHLNSGGHDARYWGSHLVEYLQFYSRALALPVPDGTSASARP